MPLRRPLRSRPLIASFTALAVGCLLVGPAFAGIAAERRPSVDESVSPASSRGPGRIALEERAIALAESSRSVPVRDGDFDDESRYCPDHRLVVSWLEPGEAYGFGAYIPPIGPRPTAATKAVNGVVVCAGSKYAYMGFEAEHLSGGWQVIATPTLVDETEIHAHQEGIGHVEEAHAHDHHHDDGSLRPKPSPRAPVGPAAFGAGIEGYARYQPQRTCDPTPKPGVVAFRDLALATYPVSRSMGISRGCSVGGTSEHKEGRAFDWGVNVNRPAEKAAAEDLIARLLATDQYGNAHALARRMGVMYIIWNRQVWASYQVSAGWRPYYGASAHTDHVHVSFSWAGALGQTSYWTGNVAAFDPAWPVPPSSSTPVPAPVAAPVPAPEPIARPEEEDEDRGPKREATPAPAEPRPERIDPKPEKAEPLKPPKPEKVEAPKPPKPDTPEKADKAGRDGVAEADAGPPAGRGNGRGKG